MAQGSGDGALVRVTAERSLLLRFAGSRPTQATSLRDMTVEIAVLRDGKFGHGATTRTDADGLAAAARAAAEAAAAGGVGAHPGLPAPGQVRGHHGWDAETAALDPAAGGRALEAAFHACAERGVEAHGVWTAAEVRTAVVSSTGTEALERLTDAFMKVTAIAPNGRSGYATQAHVAGHLLDPAGLAERAAATATVDGEARRLAPGDYPVVLEPAAV